MFEEDYTDCENWKSFQFLRQKKFWKVNISWKIFEEISQLIISKWHLITVLEWKLPNHCKNVFQYKIVDNGKVLAASEEWEVVMMVKEELESLLCYD